jgi:hypothetical protein
MWRAQPDTGARCNLEVQPMCDTSPPAIAPVTTVDIALLFFLFPYSSLWYSAVAILPLLLQLRGGRGSIGTGGWSDTPPVVTATGRQGEYWYMGCTSRSQCASEL